MAQNDPHPVRFETRRFNLYYGPFHALRNVNLQIRERYITALIGPSGCGKSSYLRSLNRMNDLLPTARTEGEILLDGQNVHDPLVNVADLRRRVTMVFQRPNPFPKSIYDNVAFGPRIHGERRRSQLDYLVEDSLRRAALWEEVKDDLKKSALSLSGGQQQRLCIARALAVQPEVILMDEPASALDPIATLRIEELIQKLKEKYTIVIVTHNMQQAARVSDFTAFFNMGEDRAGRLEEFGPTDRIFTHPRKKSTEDYISGRFG